jgi:hypothetical protein
MKRDALVQSLKSIRRALDDRVVITRRVIGRDGTVIKKIAKTIQLKEEKK